MATPRVTVDETLALSRVTVTDTAPRVAVSESGSTTGIAVTATGEVVAVTLSQSAAGVSSVNGQSGVVTGIATTAGVASSIAAIDFPVDSVNGATGTVVLTTSNISEGSNLYYTNDRFNTQLATKSTTNLSEGTNLYYTDGRVDTRLASKTTDNLTEGSTNLYFTNQRAIDAIGGSTATITPSRWDSPYTQNTYTRGYAAWAAGGTNNFSISNIASANDLTALNVSGFSTHTQPLQKWTASSSTVASMSTAGVLTANSLSLTTYPTTSNISEGTNLYYTNDRADARVAIGIANLVDSAPSTLDTLNELANALGDDANFSTTITTALGTKLATADFTSTANTWIATKNTDAITEGSTNLYYTNARADARIGAASIDALSDVVITSAAAGQMIYYNGTAWVNSATVDSANLNRFSRTNAGTGNNAILALSRNRADAARAADSGPWLAFEYVGTDNTQATSLQNAMRSMYDTAGNHKLQLLQLPGNFTTPTVMAQFQRGNTFINNTSGGNMLLLTDTAATVRGNTTTITNNANTQTYATLAAGGITLSNITTLSGAGLHTASRTIVGTPGVAENRPSMNIQLIRSDQAAPADSDGTSFRYRVGGSNGTFYTVADLGATYRTSGDNIFAVNLANGDQTGSTFSGLTTFQSKITSTTIRAGTASGTTGGSSVNDIMVISDSQILNNRAHRNSITTGTVTEGSTYTPAATASNSISLTINTGSGTTVVDLINLTGQSTGGMYTIMIYNNAASGTPIQIKNTRINTNNLTSHTIPTGVRIMVTVYIVGDYAASEHLVVP